MGRVIRIFGDTQPQDPGQVDQPTLHRAVITECHADACDGGRKPCPCPQACEISRDEHLAAVVWRLYIVAVLLVAMLAYAVLLQPLPGQP